MFKPNTSVQVPKLISSTTVLPTPGVRVRAKRNVALKIWNTIRLFVFPTSLINQGIKQPTMLYGGKKEPTEDREIARPLHIHYEC